MDIFVLFGIVFVLYFINKMALRTARNVENEEITREIGRKILQNKKLDELYGRDSGTPAQQLTKAIKDVAEDKRKTVLDANE